jgi:hypothetical protein
LRTRLTGIVDIIEYSRKIENNSRFNDPGTDNKRHKICLLANAR